MEIYLKLIAILATIKHIALSFVNTFYKAFMKKYITRLLSNFRRVIMVLGVASKISNWATNTKRIKRPLKNEPSPIMIDILNTFLLPDYAFSIDGCYLPIKFTIAPWNKRNLDTTCGGWIVLNKVWIYRG